MTCTTGKFRVGMGWGGGRAKSVYNSNQKTYGKKPLERLWRGLEDNTFLWFMLHFRFVRTIVKSDYELRHVCLSVRVEQLCFRWTEFHEILYLSIFRKSVGKIQVSLKSGKKNGYFTWRPMYIYYNISVTSSEMFQTKVVVKMKPHVLCSMTSVPKDVPFFKWMLINMAEPDRPQMTVRCLRIACYKG